jgi:hypothetical protein
VIRDKRRTAPRPRASVQSSVRVHAGSVGPLAAIAILAALASVLTGGRPELAQHAASLAGPANGNQAGGSVTAVRAAVKAAPIPDVPWLVQAADGRWAYGHGAGQAPRLLPRDETGLAIDRRWIASVIPGGDGHSTVRIRDRSGGRIVVDVAAPIWVSAGAFARAGLVVTGYGDATMTSDGGLLLISPLDASTSAIVAAQPFPERLGLPVARGGVLVSPSGTRVASNACGLELCDTQVVDLASGAISRPISAGPGFLRALTDDTIVTTDDAYQWISARRIADGGQVWRISNSILLDPIATADGSLIGVVGSAGTGWGVASIDPAGHSRNLTERSRGRQSWPRLWTDLSSTSVVVVGAEGFAETVGTGRTVPVTVLNVRDGAAAATPSSVRLPAAAETTR